MVGRLSTGVADSSSAALYLVECERPPVFDLDRGFERVPLGCDSDLFFVNKMS